MRSIESDLKSGRFKQIYLLYGVESYLVRYYKHQLVRRILGEADEMNFSRFEGRNVEEADIVEAVNTLPFFADCRVILVEATGFFDRKCEKLCALCDDIPDTSFLIFAEEKVDKRKALYKKVAKVGGIEEMKRPDERYLANWMMSRVRRAGLNMTRPAWNEFLMRTNDSMDNMSNEMDKLIAYCKDKEVIEKEDVDAICLNWLEGRIVEALASRDGRRAFALYRDMLMLREDPLHILYVLRSQFLRLMLLKEMDLRHEGDQAITERIGIPKYYLGKNRHLANNFTPLQLRNAVIDAGSLEADMKTGRIPMPIAVELLMTKYLQDPQ